MADKERARRYSFGVFEADAASGELRRQGTRIKIHAQPFQLLLMLLEHPGEVLSREVIAKELWPEGTFVDFDHGVNSAVNRIREALGDTAGNPRFVETLARRGYRFVAPVERVDAAPGTADAGSLLRENLRAEGAETVDSGFGNGILASVRELPEADHRLVKTFFLLLQGMYLAFYVGALANLAEIEELFAGLPAAGVVLDVLIVTAAILIPVRVFLLCAVLFKAPEMKRKFLRLWPFLLPLDVLWALAPFLLLHHINFGLALACMALLVYSPFAQRALMLMGAGAGPEKA